MLRRYLVALVGAVIGGGVALLIGFRFGIVSVFALGVAGFLMATGERFGLVPPSEEVNRPTSLFSDEQGRRR
ncbi:MAG: hypothetical protein QOC99_3535 [Acidobacteriota bacterium]|jgi:hypothetical protein|nr:hypothetical protein [Acidobacteriota bacterium]MDT7781023.1 hypothetical protein [Acidobacteriota bacterium]